MKVKHRVSRVRLWVMLGSILLIFVVLGARLYQISLQRHGYYAQKGQAQAEGISSTLVRGNIFLTDQDGREFLVATNRKFATLTVVPARIDPLIIDQTSGTLADITGLTRDSIATALRTPSAGSRVILRKMTDVQGAAVTALNLPGVSVVYEIDRAYPAGALAADAIGFLGYSDDGRTGQYGVEASYDAALSGRSHSSLPARWDIFGQLKRLLGYGISTDALSDDTPHDIVLTLDKNIQSYGQTVLESVLKKYHAASGTLLVQEPNSGRLLAVVDSPSFDPNTYSSFPVQNFADGAVSPFEPGSSFKPFTMAIGLQSGAVTPDSQFNDDGDVVVDGYNIKNFNEKHFGRVTMTEVLEKSINTGVMWVQQKIGNSPFLDAIINLGFGQRTGVDLPGESSGNISNLYTGRRINFMTSSFGQGISVTPLQLLNGYSAIANGGKLMKPYIVSSVRDEHGAVATTQPQIIGTPFSAKTAATLRTMLTSVVDKGFDKARIPRYDVAGKTGTAQIASPDGGYLEHEYNHSFVGFAPSGNPRFVIFIRMEKPQGITFAADSLSPSFRDMAYFLLNYFNIPPTR